MATTDRLQGTDIGVAVKPACTVVSTGALTLQGAQTVDGILVGSGERVLVKDQADLKENGIYVSDNSTWTRAKDFDGNRDAIPGTWVYVDRGTFNPGSYWVFNSSSTATNITVGTDDITLSEREIAVESTDVSDKSASPTGSTNSQLVADWLESWVTSVSAVKGYSHQVIASPIWNSSRVFFQIGSNATEANEAQFGLYVETSILDSGSTIAYQKDGIRSRVRSFEDSNAAGVSLDAVGITGVCEVSSDNTGGRVFGMNAVANVLNGGNGSIVGMEVDIEVQGSPTPIKEPNVVNQKIGCKIVSKEGAGTAALHLTRASGTSTELGWYKGLFVEQTDLIDDLDSRLFEYKDLFEVTRTGQTFIGKGGGGWDVEGLALNPEGNIIASKEDGSALYQLSRVDSSTASAAVIGDILFTQANTSTAETAYSRIRAQSDTTTAGAERATMNFFVIANGSELTSLRISGGSSDNPINIQVNGVLKNITQGATDTGGAGFRVLRVPN